MEPRGRAQQLQYQQRTQRLQDSLASVLNASQFLQKLRVRVERASLEFDSQERQALAQAIDKYIGQMNAHQTASLISYLGAFRSSSTSWRHSEDREGVVPVSREFSSARDVADHMGKIKEPDSESSTLAFRARYGSDHRGLSKDELRLEQGIRKFQSESLSAPDSRNC